MTATARVPLVRPRAPVPAWRRLDRALAVGAWAVPSTAVAAALALSDDRWTLLVVDADVRSTRLLSVALPAFFLLLLARLALAARREPRRRAALGALALAVVAWAGGAAVLNAAGMPQEITFPAPGEWLFVTCAVALAVWLLLDLPARSAVPPDAWLDALVVCGGAVSAAGVLLVTPVADGFARQGVPLLVALVYPMLDVCLLALLLGQVVLGARGRSRRTALVAGGLLALTAADASLVVNLSAGTYRYGVLLDVVWTLAFLLLVSAACRAPAPSDVVRGRTTTGRLTVGAAAVAVAVLVLLPAGEARWLLSAPAVVTLAAAATRMYRAVQQARGAAEAYRLSLTDDLTGLPNRRAVTRWLARHLPGGPSVGLLLLDLDGFKEVNDGLGHSAGDALLQILAARVDNAADDGALVARLGGDEFAILFPHGDALRIVEAAHHVRSVVRKPAVVDGMELIVDCSIGAVVSGDGPPDPAPGDLLRRADVAMYQAKSTRAGVLLYDAAKDEFSRQRLELAEELRRGIAGGELELWYQPQVDTATGRPLAVEALVRWRHPVRGVLAPGAFLAAARRSGLMPALTEATIRTAVADAARWRDLGTDVKVALNIAPAELLAADVMSTLVDLVAAAGLPAERLVVEVTEDSFLAEPERARLVLSDLRGAGLEVSIDDYGTGFSSLAYLRDLPVNELKIDRSFVARVNTDRRSLMIVSTTTDLAHGLGLRVVAEGVEDEETARRLHQLGVDVLQGYHLARPMPREDVDAWLAQRLAARSG